MLNNLCSSSVILLEKEVLGACCGSGILFWVNMAVVFYIKDIESLAETDLLCLGVQFNKQLLLFYNK